MLRTLIANAIGKIILTSTQKLKTGGGTAAPGYYALKIQPKLLSHYLPQLVKGSIVITGTNGKTTTSRLISHYFSQQQISFLHNRAGSNLERGIVSTCIAHATFSGKLKDFIYGLWEIDEAEFARSVNVIKPKYIVLLNLFRDQMDRYGEVDSTKQKWLNALKSLSYNPTIIYNANDPQIVHLIQQLKTIHPNMEASGYGLSTQEEDHSEPDLFSPVALTLCPQCKNRLKLTSTTVVGQGIFSCSKCGFSNNGINTILSIQNNIDNKSCQLQINNENYTLQTNILGTFNLYNLLAATILVKNINLPVNQFLASTNKYQSAFGRLEKFQYKNKEYIICLIKNPTGFTETLKTIHETFHNYSESWFILNDNFADGKDVSWIWDVPINKYLSQNLSWILVSGNRKFDMAIRLEYSDVTTEKIFICENWSEMFEKSSTIENKQTIPIFVTYTAMLELQKHIEKIGVKKSYWSE